MRLRPPKLVITRDEVRFSGMPNLRAQVVAPPGRIFVAFDYSQLEARLIALNSGDPWLCQVFADGRDIHSEFAAIVYPTFWEMDKEVAKKVRDNIKRGEYGAFYQGAAETIFKSMATQDSTLRLADVERMLAMMRNVMPRVTAWIAELLAFASKPPHEIRDVLLGRYRIFPLGMISPPEIVNFGIQTAGAVIMNRGLKRMMPLLEKYRNAYPVLQIHDAAVFEVDEPDAEAVAADVAEAFPQEYVSTSGIKVPFPVDHRTAYSWANL